MKTRRLLSFGLLAVAALAAVLPLAAQQGRRVFLLGGKVRDAVTNRAPEGQLVELYVFSGALVQQTFTGQDGSFDFGTQPSENYNIVVQRDGYDRAEQQVFLTTNSQDVQIELRHKRLDPNAPGGPLVSVRELSIPRKAHDAMQKGLGLVQKPDYPGSIGQFQRAVKEYPTYYEAYAQMGVVYQKMGDQKNAEQALRKSVEVSKDSYADGICMLAAMLDDQQKFADAAVLARKAIALDSTMWQAQFELARALYGLSDLAGAEAGATAAAELQPDNAETYLMLANIHSHTHEYPKMVDDLDHYLKLSPTGQQADQARQTRDQVRQALTRSSGDTRGPARTATP